MKQVCKALGVLAASIGLVLGTGTLAQAGSNGPQVCNSDPETACVKFYSDGDIIRVWDKDCDHRAAVAHVWAPSAGVYDNLWYRGGCGTYGDFKYGTSMPEDVAVYYQACTGISYDDGTYNHCSATIGGGRS